MTQTNPLPVKCACKQKKKFWLPVEQVEKKKGANPVSLQINCPFHNEEDCAKYLTVSIPAGVQLKKDETNYRGGSTF
jgi:hypothetical protein